MYIFVFQLSPETTPKLMSSLCSDAPLWGNLVTTVAKGALSHVIPLLVFPCWISFLVLIL